ncbi:MAG: DUF4260 domain-containing protein [Chitinophagaceae bacterium]
MKHILQLEELAQLALGIAALYFIPVHIAWWIWPFLFLSPDISFTGYAFNTKAGAVVYNLFHHKGIAITIAAAGFFLKNDSLLFIGALLFSHSSFDRVLGYGLKYGDSFNHTHLGWKKNQKSKEI